MASQNSWSSSLISPLDDPVTCLLTCCCPYVTYGLNATKVHGGSCPQHGITCCLAACCGIQGLYAGPTRKAIREAYSLPQVPNYLGDQDPSDFLVHSLGVISCLALCQEAHQLKTKAPSAPLTSSPDPFTPLTSVKVTPLDAPKQATM